MGVALIVCTPSVKLKDSSTTGLLTPGFMEGLKATADAGNGLLKTTTPEIN
jgi:hypothetical protein